MPPRTASRGSIPSGADAYSRRSPRPGSRRATAASTGRRRARGWSECSAAGDLGLRYAAVCVVDNLANGIGDDDLTIEELERGRERNRTRLVEALSGALPRLS